MDNNKFTELVEQVCELEQSASKLIGIRASVSENVEKFNQDSQGIIQSMGDLVDKNHEMKNEIDEFAIDMNSKFEALGTQIKEFSNQAQQSINESLGNFDDRVGEFEGKLDSQIGSLENQIQAYGEKSEDSLDKRFKAVTEALEGRIAAFETEMNEKFQKFTQISQSIETQMDKFSKTYESIIESQTRLDALIEEERRQHEETRKWAKIFRIFGKKDNNTK